MLWWWVFLVGSSVILGWLLGDWHSAWSVVQTIALIIAGLSFVYLIAAGFIASESATAPIESQAAWPGRASEAPMTVKSPAAPGSEVSGCARV